MNEKEMRELDAWIAKNVMGWKSLKKPFGITEGTFCFRTEVLILDVGNRLKYFHPTTDPAAALSVLERCATRGKVSEHNILIFQPADGPHAWAVGAEFVYEKDEIEPECADTLPLAICLFARTLFSKE